MKKIITMFILIILIFSCDVTGVAIEENLENHDPILIPTRDLISSFSTTFTASNPENLFDDDMTTFTSFVLPNSPVEIEIFLKERGFYTIEAYAIILDPEMNEYERTLINFYTYIDDFDSINISNKTFKYIENKLKLKISVGSNAIHIKQIKITKLL